MDAIISSFKSFLGQSANLTDSDFELMRPHLTCTHLKKKETFIEAGKMCKDLHFVVSGLLRIYGIIDGKIITQHFIEDTHFYTDFESMMTQCPCEHYVDALEPTIVLSMPYQKMLEAYDHSHRIERLGRLMVERAFFTFISLNDLATKTNSRMRYEEFESKNPELAQRIPLKVLASFLGMTPESLSRIRRQRVLS